MNINERISYILELKGLNKNSFSQKTGIKPQTLHHIISERKTKPSFSVIEKILLTFKDINAEWLITGHGKAIIKNSEYKEILPEQAGDFDMLCPVCKCQDYKVIEMAKRLLGLKQQIIELQQDKEDLRTALKLLEKKIEKINF